jgi:hypothetical protein
MKENVLLFLLAVGVYFSSLFGYGSLANSLGLKSDYSDAELNAALISSDMNANAEAFAVDRSTVDDNSARSISLKDIVAVKKELEASEGKTVNPTLIEFLQYLLATVTGFLAIFLRKIIRKWIPEFPDKQPRNDQIGYS